MTTTPPLPSPPADDAIRFALNGRLIDLAGRDALRPLSTLLRDRLGLTGTKVVCAEGDCGACTVLLGRPIDGTSQREERFDYRPVDSCIVFAFQCHGAHVVTVEGLHPTATGCTRQTRDKTNKPGTEERHDEVAGPCHNALTVIQNALVHGHGSQCGFCTPGIVMALHALRERGRDLSESSVRHALSGNLCRCTGYQQIFDACEALKDVQDIATLDDTYDEPALLQALTKNQGQGITLTAEVPCSLTLEGEGRSEGESHRGQERNGQSHKDQSRNGKTHDGASAERWMHASSLPTRTVTLRLPGTLDEALAVKREHPEALVVAGATDAGVWHNHGAPWPDHVLCVTALPGLSACDNNGDTLALGGGATWDTISDFLAPHFPALAEILDRFGSPQIRQLGTIAGNLANGSPIADSLPFLFVMDAAVEARSSSRGSRRIPVTSFYTGYKQNVLEPDELIAAVHVPKPADHERLHLEKTSKRRDMDISTFTAAIRLTLDQTGNTIETAAVAMGGVGPVVVRLPNTEAALKGQPFSEDTMRIAGQTARHEIAPISDVRGSAPYRFQLAENVFRKAFHQWNETPVMT